MASLQDLETALVNADKAGDAASARVLAGEIMKMRAPKKGPLDYVDDVGRSFASGATFGFMDEIAAGVDAAFGRGTYEQNVARERARDEQIPTALALPGQVAGAIGTTLLAGPALAATKAVQALPNIARWAGLGAVEGGISGAGNAVEGERAAGAGTGALIGAPVGAAAPYAVRGAANVAGSIKNAISPGAQQSADLARAIMRDADDPASLMARANNASIDRPGQVTLADVGGENVRGLVERIAQTPGAGRTQVVPALTEKQRSQVYRISSDLRSLTGTNRTAYQAVEETIAERAGSAAPLYRQAYEEGDRALWSPGLERLTGAPSFQRAMQGAVRVWQDQAIADGFGAMRPGALVENGMIRFQRGAIPAFPNLQFWDYTKRILDDQVRTAMRAGQNQKAQALGRIAEQFRTELDTLVPDSYRAARNSWAGPSQYLDAIEQGRSFLTTREASEEFTARFRASSPIQQEGERIGIVSSIVSKMGNDGGKLADLTKYLRSPEMRAKIAAIMPTEEAAQAWARRLEYEIQSSEMTGRALGGSQTARRLAEQEDQRGLAIDLVFDALAQAPVSFIRRVLTAGPKWLRDTARSRSDALMADTLTNPAAINNLPGILNQVNQVSVPRLGNGANMATTVGGVELLTGQ